MKKSNGKAGITIGWFVIICNLYLLDQTAFRYLFYMYKLLSPFPDLLFLCFTMFSFFSPISILFSISIILSHVFFFFSFFHISVLFLYNLFQYIYSFHFLHFLICFLFLFSMSISVIFNVSNIQYTLYNIHVYCIYKGGFNFRFFFEI